VNQQQRKAGSNLRVLNTVYVLNQRGCPLMPTSQAKARHLLKEGKAKVIKRLPFVIQLKIATGETKQPVTFGMDSGYTTIGFSATTDKEELASGELRLDSKTSSRLTEKRMYRRGRRNKLWYRKPRFDNRKINTCWLPPSTQRRYDTHLNLLHKYQKLLPITSIFIETANFDIQKIMNPDIERIEYQRGSMYGYQNMRSYLMAREKGCCQICGKKFDKGNPSHIHHKKQRNEEGSNRPENLAIVHEDCHTDLHKKGLKLKAPKEFKAETFMSIIQHKFEQDIPNVNITFGYKTFVDRIALGLEKTHYNDAFVIAQGTNQERCLPVTIVQKHRNNRAIQLNRKGFAPSIRRQRYSIQPQDIITIKNKEYVSKGIFNKGKYVVCTDRFRNKFNLNTKLLDSIFHVGSLVWKMEGAIPPSPKGVGILAQIG
jgi:hypothetical protein